MDQRDRRQLVHSYSPGAAWRMRLHSEKMERAFAILIAIEGVEVSS